jgi:hypothetical protein
MFDDRGNRMTPSHSNKAGVRYRYYVSHRGAVAPDFDLTAVRGRSNLAADRGGCLLAPALPRASAHSSFETGRCARML